jgi:hypothetical protein
LRAVQSRRPSLPYIGLLIVVFAYLLFARTHASPSSFLLLRDQIRDWRLALGPFRSLPLTGPQSTAGGAALGPVYYWILWLSRTLIGPWMHNLPHAGAYGIALLQGGADIALLDTLRRRLGSVWPALAVVLLAATSSHDLAVSATIWNPAVSVAFVKLAIALRLRYVENDSLWWTAATTIAAWFAVQAHSAAIFVAAPVSASYVLADFLRHRPVRALQHARAVVEVVALLQVPFLLHMLTQSSEAAPTRALGGASSALLSGHVRLGDSAHALMESVPSILFAPWRYAAWSSVLIVCALVAIARARRDLALLSVSVAPLAAAVAGLALWQGNYDEYWYLPLAPCGALVIVYALTWWRPAVTGAVLAVAVVAAQPARIAHSMGWYRMPEYGPTVAGATKIMRQTATVRRLDTTFPMPPFSNAAFPFEAMGGRLSDDAEFDALIDRNGDVQFRRVTQ